MLNQLISTAAEAAETSETAIMHFGSWFMGGDVTFGSLATQVGLATLNLTVLLWVAKWIYSILIELTNKKGGFRR